MVETVADINSWRLFSLNKIAKLAGCSREKVQTSLARSRVQAGGIRDGFPVYDIWDAANAILVGDYSDPDSLRLEDQLTLQKIKVLKQEEKNLQLKNDTTEKNLIDYDEAKTVLAEIIKSALNLLDSIPDNLERDYNLPLQAVLDIEKNIENKKTEWANQLESWATANQQ